MNRKMIFFLLSFGFLAAAFAQDSSYKVDGYVYRVKGAVKLQDGRRIRIKGISYAEDGQVKLFTPQVISSPDTTNRSVFQSDYQNLQTVLVPIDDLQKIRVNRKSFLHGLLVGGLVGYGLGYAYGRLSYKDDIEMSAEENHENSRLNGTLFGLIGAVPTGVAGGLVAPLFFKKSFTINGSRAKLKQTIYTGVN